MKRRWMSAFIAASAWLGQVALAQASEGHGGHGGEHGGGELVINWWTWDAHAPPVGWFIFDFVLFVALMVYFLRKPLATAFAQRHNTIKKAVADAAVAHAKASAVAAELGKKRSGAENEVRQLLSQNTADGELERQRIIENAREVAARLEQDAAAIARQEEEKAREKLFAFAARQALDIAEKKLSQELTPADRTRLLEQSLTQLETETFTMGSAA